MRDRIVLFTAVACIFAFELFAAVIFRDGQVEAEILIPADPYPMEMFSAKELSEHLKKITGSEFAILRESEATGKLPIRIGRSARLPDRDWTVKNQGWLVIQNDCVDLGGYDDPKNDGLALQSSCGSARAVYSLLENELGVRWLWQGESGVYAPKRETIDLADASRKTGTNFTWCWWWVHPSLGADLWRERKNFDTYFKETILWMRRHGFTTATGSIGSYGHSFETTYQEYSAEHPEYFNLLPNGKREPSPLYLNGQAKYVSMCISNPEVEKYVLNRWEPGRYLNVNENDVPGSCTCDSCMAADMTGDVEGRRERAAKAFLAGDQYWYEELGSVTNRYASFVQRVIPKAKAMRPDGVTILFDAYSNHWRAPDPSIKLDPCVLTTFCPPFAYPLTTTWVNECKEAWNGWHKTGTQLMFRPNTTFDGHNFPLVYYPEFLDLFDFAAANGAMGSSMDSYTGACSGNALTLYMIAAKHGHGIGLPISQLEDEFFQAFGAAEKQIREYWGYFRRLTLEGGKNFEPSHNLVGNDFYAWFYTVSPKVFTDDDFAEAARILESARKAAGGDEDVLAKIRYLELGMTDARLTLATELGYETYRDTGNVQQFTEAVHRLDAFRNANEGEIYGNVGYFAKRENENWPRYLADVPENSRKLELEICFDPSEAYPGDGKWQPASPETWWEDLPAGKEWENANGAPYKGAAWYRAKFHVSADDVKRVQRLLFGAVDGSGIYYINGKKIWEREYPYQGDENSWKKPFSVLIPEETLVQGENLLTVRVEKHIGSSGIWRPIYLNRLESFTMFSMVPVEKELNAATEGLEDLFAGKRWEMYPRPKKDGTVIRQDGVVECYPDEHTHVCGATMSVNLDCKEIQPIVFSVESRGENVRGPRIQQDYVVCLDVIFQDGTVRTGVSAPFGKGTFDWKKSGGIYLPDKPVRRVNFYAVCSRINGMVYFRNPKLYLLPVQSGK